MPDFDLTLRQEQDQVLKPTINIVTSRLPESMIKRAKTNPKTMEYLERVEKANA